MPLCNVAVLSLLLLLLLFVYFFGGAIESMVSSRFFWITRYEMAQDSEPAFGIRFCVQSSLDQVQYSWKYVSLLNSNNLIIWSSPSHTLLRVMANQMRKNIFWANIAYATAKVSIIFQQKIIALPPPLHYLTFLKLYVLIYPLCKIHQRQSYRLWNFFTFAIFTCHCADFHCFSFW